ncbi:MAG: LptF/LptG family permease [Candidatus Margulisiibacteriota bacterium]
MKTLDRYVFVEVMGPFIVGVVGFILVLTVDLLFTMTDLVINKGVPFFTVFKLMAYKLPSFLVMTFPVSTLFGTSMALGRFSKDNELTALRTSGISLFRICFSIFAIGLMVSFISFFINEKIVPHANYVSNNIIRQIVYKQPFPEIKENVFFKDPQNRYYYAGKVNMKNKTMDNIMVYEMTNLRFPRTILALSGNFKGRMWELNQGVVHQYDNKGFTNYEASFETMRLNIGEDILNYTDQKGMADMSSGELGQMIASLGKGGGNVASLLTEFYMKYSIPLTCFVFALVGIPFSIFSPRSGRTWGLIVTIVFMFTFYVFASVFRSLGKGGILPPFAAAFSPQLLFLMIGSVLLYYEGKFH